MKILKKSPVCLGQTGKRNGFGCLPQGKKKPGHNYQASKFRCIHLSSRLRPITTLETIRLAVSLCRCVHHFRFRLSNDTTAGLTAFTVSCDRRILGNFHNLALGSGKSNPRLHVGSAQRQSLYPKLNFG